ncbi:MAG: RNB domain-containing ribonuclease [Acidobacteriaceae bacterium]|jgi:exoribonuclease-2
MNKPPFDLAASAQAEMIKNGFHPDFPAGSDAQIAAIRAAVGAAAKPDAKVRDLRGPWWSSIDNDTSKDLDQIEMAERVDGGIRVRVAIANVAAAIAKGSPLDLHAAQQTQTVYTAVRIFPMLPTDLSTDLTSLNQDVDRAALVTEYVVDAQGNLTGQTIYRAQVRNRAQLAYSKVGPWLEGTGPADAKVAASAELQAQLHLQYEAARAMHARRAADGALEFCKGEADPVVIDGKVRAIHEVEQNCATDLIEEFMIGANKSVAETLRAAGRSCIRRVVRVPERWDRIVALAAQHGTKLPATPDSKALNDFLTRLRKADSVHYPDLALAVIKLMGPGEYVVITANDPDPLGHFGLAAKDYLHSTAPNRRYADLVSERIVAAMLDGVAPPYSDAELGVIAQQCNLQEKAANKVERTMQKREAAVALAGSVGKTFHGVVTGADQKGTYVRVLDPPVEGRIIRGEQGLDVGDTVNVQLVDTNPQMAYIDFARA